MMEDPNYEAHYVIFPILLSRVQIFWSELCFQTLSIFVLRMKGQTSHLSSPSLKNVRSATWLSFLTLNVWGHVSYLRVSTLC